MLQVYFKINIGWIMNNTTFGQTVTQYTGFLVTQMVKNLPAMPETWVQSLGWEDTLEKDIETHSSILAWRILMDRGA